MHKPLAQALVMIAAAAVASDEPSSGRRLAARRGRRRPVKRETESSHGLKETAPQLGKRAAPDSKTRFMLLSTQRSGTHYVMHELRMGFMRGCVGTQFAARVLQDPVPVDVVRRHAQKRRRRQRRLCSRRLLRLRRRRLDATHDAQGGCT